MNNKDAIQIVRNFLEDHDHSGDPVRLTVVLQMIGTLEKTLGFTDAGEQFDLIRSAVENGDNDEAIEYLDSLAVFEGLAQWKKDVLTFNKEARFVNHPDGVEAVRPNGTSCGSFKYKDASGWMSVPFRNRK